MTTNRGLAYLDRGRSSPEWSHAHSNFSLRRLWDFSWFTGMGKKDSWERIEVFLEKKVLNIQFENKNESRKQFSKICCHSWKGNQNYGRGLDYSHRFSRILHWFSIGFYRFLKFSHYYDFINNSST